MGLIERHSCIFKGATMIYKIGDCVILHKPENVDEHPTWCDEMDELDGAEVTIEEYEDDTCFYAKDVDFWVFNESWATPVELIEDSENISFF